MASHSRQILVAALVVVHLLVDFAGALVIEMGTRWNSATEFLNGFWLGQIVCLACWSAWERQAWRKRLSQAVWLLAFSSLTILAGLKAFPGTDLSLGPTFGIEGPVVCSFSILTFGLSWAVLSVVRRFRHFRLATSDSISKKETSQPGQFTIRDILLWTARVGLVLGMGNWAIDAQTLEAFGSVVNAFHWYLGVWIWLAVASAIAVAIGIPSILVALAPPARSLWWTIVWYGALVLLAIVRVRDFTDDEASVTNLILRFASECDLLALGVLAAVVPSLWILRACGYRFTRTPEQVERLRVEK